MQLSRTIYTLFMCTMLMSTISFAFFDDIYAALVQITDKDYCTKNSHCPSHKKCVSGRCILREGHCESDSDCHSLEVCNKESRICIFHGAPRYCREDSDCVSWKYCYQNECRLKPGACDFDYQCDLSRKCGKDHTCEYTKPLNPIEVLVTTVLGGGSNINTKTQDVFDYVNTEAGMEASGKMANAKRDTSTLSDKKESSTSRTSDNTNIQYSTADRRKSTVSGESTSVGNEGSTLWGNSKTSSSETKPSSAVDKSGTTSSGQTRTADNSFSTSQENKYSSEKMASAGSTPSLTHISDFHIKIWLPEGWVIEERESIKDKGVMPEATRYMKSYLISGKAKKENKYIFINAHLTYDDSKVIIDGKYLRDYCLGIDDFQCMRTEVIDSRLGSICIYKPTLCVDSNYKPIECWYNYILINPKNCQYVYTFSTATKDVDEEIVREYIYEIMRNSEYY